MPNKGRLPFLCSCCWLLLLATRHVLAEPWAPLPGNTGPLPQLKTAEQVDQEARDFEGLSAVARALECSAKYPEFDPIIAQHLKAWKDGIPLQLILDTIHNHTTRTASGSRTRGFAAGFRSGKAVLLDLPRLAGVLRWPTVMFTHMRMLHDLQTTFGHTLPDLDMVIAVADMPTVLRSPHDPSHDPPLMRYCKTDDSPDILIPNFHAHTLGVYNDLVRSSREFNEVYQWHTKLNQALYRGTLYERYSLCAARNAVRLGPGGKNICQECSEDNTRRCDVRLEFTEWAHKEHPDVLDVSVNHTMKFVPMNKQPRFRYLVHLDGLALSSRMEQLLPLGSLVFREESGYQGYLYPLMKPGVHYLPFWKEVPEELLDGLLWAREHDQEAQRIALQGQAFAQTYVTRKARACYWFKLLRAYGGLHSYKPAEVPATNYTAVPEGADPGQLQAFDPDTEQAINSKAIDPGQTVLVSDYLHHVAKQLEKDVHVQFTP